MGVSRDRCWRLSSLYQSVSARKVFWKFYATKVFLGNILYSPGIWDIVFGLEPLLCQFLLADTSSNYLCVILLVGKMCLKIKNDSNSNWKNNVGSDEEGAKEKYSVKEEDWTWGYRGESNSTEMELGHTSRRKDNRWSKDMLRLTSQGN